MKKLFGEVQITKGEYPDSCCSYIELEYYKIKKRNRKRSTLREKTSFYGIEIVKKEIEGKKKNVEKERIEYITSDENNIHQMLYTFRDNLVTPMGLQESVEEFSKKELLKN